MSYTRVRVTNNGSQAAYVPPDASGPGLVELTSPPDLVRPGQTVQHDFVAAVDTLGSGQSLPTPTQLITSAAGYKTAFRHMAGYWNINGARVAGLGTKTVLRGGSPTATNSISDPVNIAPKTSPMRDLSSSFGYTFAPYSVTVLALDRAGRAAGAGH